VLNGFSDRLRGVFTALPTPLNDNGRIDLVTMTRLLEFQRHQKIDGIVPAGTTAGVLEEYEQMGIIGFVLRYGQSHGLHVLPGLGSNSTRHSIKLTEFAVSLGAKAGLYVDPYYYCPNSVQLRMDYYSPLAQTFPGFGIVPYVIPGRTGGTGLEPRDLSILANSHPNIIGVKYAASSHERAAKMRSLCPTLRLMSGDDDQTLPLMRDSSTTFDGAISVMSNVIPLAIGKMIRRQRSGKAVEAAKISQQIAPLLGIVSVRSGTCDDYDFPGHKKELLWRNPLPLLTMMAGLGMIPFSIRQPLGKMPLDAVLIVRSALRQVWTDAQWALDPIADCFGVNVEERIEDDQIWQSLARAC